MFICTTLLLLHSFSSAQKDINHHSIYRTDINAYRQKKKEKEEQAKDAKKKKMCVKTKRTGENTGSSLLHGRGKGKHGESVDYCCIFWYTTHNKMYNRCSCSKTGRTLHSIKNSSIK
jgi:hypothetical protein